MLKIRKTFIKDLYIIEPQVFKDKRGYFMETYNKADFLKFGLNYNFIQDNQSKSTKGVLRGLHFQVKHPQAKLVRVIKGRVFDVAVDLRKESKTFGQYFGIVLSSKNKKQLLIPKGFAHGFLVLSSIAEFAYKCDEFYHPEDEAGIIYNDQAINIKWPTLNVKYNINEKDLKHNTLRKISCF